ncbi:endoplasmic reticulum-Golgi intermediate compartment protein 3 [Aplysia californica]|uniref:Endoplasmic reticulum-Golgi intermediate compartment protein 3 n=1 Tax=Aplysia californica TaxID=6500 RepID=A0ABM1AD29_APLCA|nr:endoplasmic reticulum-Golgi intermediate compartment protein 3 [Aplysia californica]
MQAKDVFDKLRRFDAYPKTLEDFRVKTYGGAAVTVVSAVLMCVLFVSELNYYLTKEVHPELFVDTSRGQKLRINIDIVFPNMACAFLSLDAMDVSGESQIDVDGNLFKQRLDLGGRPVDEAPEIHTVGSDPGDNATEVASVLDPDRCESCYGAENPDMKCCNTCEEVREAYRRKGWAFQNPDSIEQCKREGWAQKMEAVKNEGCKLFGYLEVNKVAGNFHLAPGKSFQQKHVHVHDLQSLGGQKFNVSHRINHLSFGQDYPGIVNPLDNVNERVESLQMMFQYFIKIVPTTYTKVNGETLFTNQYSVTKHSKSTGSLLGETGLPGVFFSYELSPMMVRYTEKHRSFMHFLTGVCAIIGGVFTVAGLIDSMIYHSSRAITRKIELGKAS